MNIENINKVIEILRNVDDEDYNQDIGPSVREERTCGCMLVHTQDLWKGTKFRIFLDIGFDESSYLKNFSKGIEHTAIKKGWPLFDEIESERLRAIERLKYLRENFTNKA